MIYSQEDRYKFLSVSPRINLYLYSGNNGEDTTSNHIVDCYLFPGCVVSVTDKQFQVCSVHVLVVMLKMCICQLQTFCIEHYVSKNFFKFWKRTLIGVTMFMVYTPGTCEICSSASGNS